MAELEQTLLNWLQAGRRFSVAIVVETWASAPRPAGSMMAVASDGQTVGSLSGGCVESAVHELALEVLATGQAKLSHYGTSDDEAYAVGLACGGQIEALVIPVVDEARRVPLAAYMRALEESRPAALALELPVIRETSADEVFGRAAEDSGASEGIGGTGRMLFIEPAEGAAGVPSSAGRDSAAAEAGAEWRTSGTLGHPRLDEHVTTDAGAMIAQGRSGVREYDSTGMRLGAGTRIFVTTSDPPPRLIIFGAIDYAAALSQLGKFLGYQVTVCDARPIFATPERFPDADEVIVSWPHRYLAEEVRAGRIEGSTVIAVLTHDLKFDVPVLLEAARSVAGYIGALGSRRTHRLRVEAMSLAGASAAEIDRIHGPIGLDLGARSPEATAVSIFAEVLLEFAQGSGLSLRRTSGPIHS
ncbi:XdhC/CoxI family protein [Brevibacterium sp. RIT 803]|uniref:XdhC family protein n=1 Tax=Brevibacterium sp. RIT 803 TaxID=2810210 RepID=UPI0019526FC2|nr:XdhC/CoxI family protein [Brevibacterium sp. RIT 803]MBM6591498.1 XdhC family protein [Brevibacterium sp. RIT 803]